MLSSESSRVPRSLVHAHAHAARPMGVDRERKQEESGILQVSMSFDIINSITYTITIAIALHTRH